MRTDSPLTLLSLDGSDRATAYTTSNKIVRHDGRLFVGWLDAPPEVGQLAANRLAICDERSGEVERVLTLGKAYDNHGGPALAMDGNGRLHAMVGAHHHPLLYRWSDRPGDAESWSEPVALGPFATYPSLVVDREGTLHLAHRHMDDRWQLWYRRKRHGKPWEPWVVMAVGPLPGYNHFYQTLNLGPGGALHLLFQFFYTETGKSADARGRMAVAMTSEDGGNTWFNEGRRCEGPLTVETAAPVCRSPEGGGVRISNAVVDEANRLWFFAALPGCPQGALFRRTDAGWTTVDTSAAFGALNLLGGRETSLSRDPSGRIHLAIGTPPDGAPSKWYDPRHEIFHLLLSANGDVESLTQVTQTDPAAASWLPALEHWDWNRPRECCAPGPALAFTHGRAGDRGTNLNASKTTVFLAPRPLG